MIRRPGTPGPPGRSGTPVRRPALAECQAERGSQQPLLPSGLIHLSVCLVGRGPGSHGEGTCTDLVLFMDRTESTEEELNDGQVIIARSNVQTGVACLRTEITL